MLAANAGCVVRENCSESIFRRPLNHVGETCLKRIGLIGGMSWESTIPCYQVIDRAVADRLGGLHSADLLLHSVDFHQIERLQCEDRWQEAGETLTKVTHGLETAGAEFQHDAQSRRSS